jgi:hypothetical protein
MRPVRRRRLVNTDVFVLDRVFEDAKGEVTTLIKRAFDQAGTGPATASSPGQCCAGNN